MLIKLLDHHKIFVFFRSNLDCSLSINVARISLMKLVEYLIALVKLKLLVILNPLCSLIAHVLKLLVRDLFLFFDLLFDFQFCSKLHFRELAR